MPNAVNPQNWNRYSYVSNNPLKYTDPTGHMQIEDSYTSSNGTCRSGDTSCNWVGKSKTKNKDKKPTNGNGNGSLVTVVPPRACSGINCPIVETHVTPYPTTLTYHPLERNVIYDLPIYDDSYYPPKVIGRQSLYYTHDDIHFSLKNFLVPSDPVTWASAAQTVGDAVLNVGSKNLGELAKLVTPVCPECVIALSVAAGIDSANSAVTFDGHLEEQTYYFTYQSPFETPFDPKKVP